MKSKNVVFTPLRIALIISIVVSNALAVISLFVEKSPATEALGIFAVVFIMLFVFVILLEVVWLHHRAKAITDPATLSRYRAAKIIYSLLFICGFIISYWAILK
ncbi:hypothetical protein [Marinicella litoralis]|uniref:Uncharacterized protein n=1 Tax=Marinicella litoralis TaxID=644220 RepID=A0A4R6XTQ1_9GAMM|nr:hypothetical protein [Marinicella litoralis]TDR23345.1 hypothetical protein C8D91_0205 [Marinicella litoralis]